MKHAYAIAHKWMTTPFIWGETDCGMSVADYLISLGYPDIFPHIRGSCDSAASCQRQWDFLNKMVDIVADGVARIPLARTDTPRAGDIGVVRIADALGKRHAVTALFLGKNWAVKSEHSVIVGPAIEVLAAWRVDRA